MTAVLPARATATLSRSFVHSLAAPRSRTHSQDLSLAAVGVISKMAFLAAKEDSYLKEPVPAVLRSSGEIAIRYPLWKQAIYGIGSMSYGITLMIVSFYQLPFLLEVAQIRAAYVHQSYLGVSLARSLFLVCACSFGVIG